MLGYYYKYLLSISYKIYVTRSLNATKIHRIEICFFLSERKMSNIDKQIGKLKNNLIFFLNLN